MPEQISGNNRKKFKIIQQQLTPASMSYQITAWYQRKDDWHDESVGTQASLEGAMKDAEAYATTRRPYSMSVTHGQHTWKWKPGRSWELQRN